MKGKILLVDDHSMVRSGVRMALAEHDHFLVVGEASTGEKALEKARETKPDVILMDLHLPDISGIEVSRRILSEQSSVRIIIFSSEVRRAWIEEALQAGIGGYISKACTAEEIVQAITAVSAGKLYMSADVSAELLKDASGVRPGDGAKAGSSITARERELLRLLSAGRRNKEIASELSIAVKSVEEKTRLLQLRRVGPLRGPRRHRPALRTRLGGGESSVFLFQALQPAHQLR
jgi:DNA-binding NarL/FixJ family response regulator